MTSALPPEPSTSTETDEAPGVHAQKMSLIAGSVLVVILLTLCCSWWWLQRGDQRDDSAATVGEAVNSMAGDGGTNASQHYSNGNPTGPINDLLESLGLPEAAFSRYDAGDAKAKFVERYQLEQVLARAVSAGTIDHYEAAAVLKAYDSGLVSPAGGQIVLNDQGNTGNSLP